MVHAELSKSKPSESGIALKNLVSTNVAALEENGGVQTHTDQISHILRDVQQWVVRTANIASTALTHIINLCCQSPSITLQENDIY